MPPEAMAILSQSPVFTMVRLYRAVLLGGRARRSTC
jgi:hypothetical protein